MVNFRKLHQMSFNFSAFSRVGIIWNADTDPFLFKIKLNVKYWRAKAFV